MKKTKLFEKNLIYLVFKVAFFQLVLFEYRGFAESLFSFLDNGSKNAIIISNLSGFCNTRKKLVFCFVIIKGYF